MQKMGTPAYKKRALVCPTQARRPVAALSPAVDTAMAPQLTSWFRSSKRRDAEEREIAAQFDSPLLTDDEQHLAQHAHRASDVFTISLSRNESGLGLVFDPEFFVTKLHPGCAAERHGGVRIGDRLLAVDGIELLPGDRVGAYFPMHVSTFELRLLREPGLQVPARKSSRSSRNSSRSSSFGQTPLPDGMPPPRMNHAQRVANRREQSGKFEP